MSNESFVQVAPDSTGKKIRNVLVYALQADGSMAPVQMQAIQIMDAEGNQVLFRDEYDLQQQILDELRATRIGMQLLVDWINPSSAFVQTQPIPGGVSVPKALLNVEEKELIEMAKDFRSDENPN